MSSSGLPSLKRKTNRDFLEGVEWRVTEFIEGLEYLAYEETLSNLGLFSRGKRRLRGDLIIVYKYLMGGVRQMDEAMLFSMVHSDRTRNNSLTLKQRKFQTKIMWKNFFMVRVMEHWNRLPREVVESPAMEIFKTHLDVYLCDLW